MIRYESTRTALWSYLRFRRVAIRLVPDFGQPFMMVHHQVGDRFELLVSQEAGQYPVPEQNTCFGIEVARAMLGHVGYVPDAEQAEREDQARKQRAAKLLIPDEAVQYALAQGWSVTDLARDAGVTHELAALRMADYKVLLFVIQVKHQTVPLYDNARRTLIDYGCLEVKKSYKSLDPRTKTWCKHSPRSAMGDHWKVLQLYGKKLVARSVEAGLFDRYKRVDHWIMTVVAVG
jgi:hypothetical protein